MKYMKVLLAVTCMMLMIVILAAASFFIHCAIEMTQLYTSPIMFSLIVLYSSQLLIIACLLLLLACVLLVWRKENVHCCFQGEKRT